MKKRNYFFSSVFLFVFTLFFGLLPVSAQTPAFTFVAWADTKSDTNVLKNLSNQIKTLNPALTIYPGDLESDGFTTAGMDAWKNAANGGANNGIFDKTFPVRGNHDDHLSGSSGNWQNYFNLSTQATRISAANYSALSDDLTYSFDYGNSRFIGIDVPGSVTLMSAAQIAWLDQRLTDAESRGLTHAFLFWHGPIYSIANHCCPVPSAALVNTLNKHPIVSAGFYGHEHSLAYIHINSSRIPGITHEFEEIVSGDAGAGPTTPSSGKYDYFLNLSGSNTGGFVLVSVNEGAFTVDFYKGGTTTSQYTKTFSKSGTTPSPSISPTPTPIISAINTPTPSISLTSPANSPSPITPRPPVCIYFKN